MPLVDNIACAWAAALGLCLSIAGLKLQNNPFLWHSDTNHRPFRAKFYFMMPNVNQNHTYLYLSPAEKDQVVMPFTIGRVMQTVNDL